MNARRIHVDQSLSRGLSLVELMVAMTVGLLLLGGLTSIVLDSSRSFGELTKTSRQLENGRFAVQLLKDEIEHAGFYGEYANLTPPSAFPDPCENADLSALAEGLLLPVQGYDAPTGTILSCLADANHIDGTDVLVLRRAATEATALASLDPNEMYIQTTSNADPVLDTGANAVSFTLTRKDAVTPADVRKLRVDIYFISPCNVPSGGTSCDVNADGGNPVPTLKRLSLLSTASGPEWVFEPLAEGIEDLQIEYGIDRENIAASVQFNGIPNESAPGAGDSYVAAPATLDEWANVVALRIYLLARNADPTTGYEDVKVYNLGLAGSRGPFNDQFKRRVFTRVIRAVNPSSRRETPG